jgi:hypothetical protein
MKKVLPVIIIFIMTISPVRAQYLADPNKPYTYLNTTPGYITINDVTFGFPSGNGTSPYSGSFFGFTTIHGYQMNRYFIAGAGAGASFYQNGTQVPVFLHIRYSFILQAISPVLLADGGFLFGTQAQAVLFINPGLGIRYSLNQNFGINFATGVYLFSDPSRQSLVNLRLGLTFKPSKPSRKR